MVGPGSSAIGADVYELSNCFKGVLLLMLRSFRLLSLEWDQKVNYIRSVDACFVNFHRTVLYRAVRYRIEAVDEVLKPRLIINYIQIPLTPAPLLIRN